MFNFPEDPTKEDILELVETLKKLRENLPQYREDKLSDEILADELANIGETMTDKMLRNQERILDANQQALMRTNPFDVKEFCMLTNALNTNLESYHLIGGVMVEGMFENEF